MANVQTKTSLLCNVYIQNNTSWAQQLRLIRTIISMQLQKKPLDKKLGALTAYLKRYLSLWTESF